MLAEELVEKQLSYYNNHDVEGFISTYDEDIKIYDLVTNTITLQGIKDLRIRYKERFEISKVHAKIKNRIVIGSKVIDHEYVTTVDSKDVVKAVAIYEVANDKIIKVWFLFE